MNEITIRKVTPDDARRLLEIYSYYVTDTAISFEYDVPSPAEFRKRIETISAFYPYLAAECGGRIVGYAYAHPFVGRKAYDWSAELTVYVDKDYRRCGAGKKLYLTLERCLAKMGVTNLYACIGVPEKDDEYLTRNSLEFHEHMGFKAVGMFSACGRKFGRWYDMVWAEKIIAEHCGEVKDVVSFNSVKVDLI